MDGVKKCLAMDSSCQWLEDMFRNIGTGESFEIDLNEFVEFLESGKVPTPKSTGNAFLCINKHVATATTTLNE